jgi:hypothetical protein
MVKTLLKRISVLEKTSSAKNKLLVIKDFYGLYSGECGKGLSQEQFDAWTKQQNESLQIIVAVFGCINKEENVVAQDNC